jgi:hypothetical protein
MIITVVIGGIVVAMALFAAAWVAILETYRSSSRYRKRLCPKCPRALGLRVYMMRIRALIHEVCSYLVEAYRKGRNHAIKAS